jgi:DNA gyrase/topoisomerase IV subunit A
MRSPLRADAAPENAGTRARLNVLEAIGKALDRRDEFFRVVSAADDVAAAEAALMATFDVDQPGAAAMLDLQARRFTADHRRWVADEHAALSAELSGADSGA